MISDAYDIDMMIEEGLHNHYNSDKIALYTKIGNAIYNISNVFDVYIDYLKEISVNVKLDDKDMYRYKYNPKMLSLDLYQTEELYVLLLKLNNCSHEIDFNNNNVYVLRPNDIDILNTILMVSEKDIETNRNSIK